MASDESVTSGVVATAPNSPDIPSYVSNAEIETDLDYLIGELYPLNKLAKDAFQRLVARSGVPFYEHHYRFLDVTSKCFVFSLNNLPEFAPIGWRVGRGRSNLKNLGVDILLLMDEHSDDIAGNHALFAWVKGGGGFFLVADNIRGKTVTLNGEELSNEQLLIPYRNTIGIGECYFTLKFPRRTAEQDDHRTCCFLSTYS